ncbi:MAG: hypothetical protein AB8C84_02990 [Oligoflexales bacterium]
MLHIFYIIFYFCFALHLIDLTLKWHEKIQHTATQQQSCEYALAYCAYQLSFEHNTENALTHLFPFQTPSKVHLKKNDFLHKYDLRDCKKIKCLGFQAQARQKKNRHFPKHWPLWAPGLTASPRTL